MYQFVPGVIDSFLQAVWFLCKFGSKLLVIIAGSLVVRVDFQGLFDLFERFGRIFLFTSLNTILYSAIALAMLSSALGLPNFLAMLKQSMAASLSPFLMWSMPSCRCCSHHFASCWIRILLKTYN